MAEPSQTPAPAAPTVIVLSSPQPTRLSAAAASAEAGNGGFSFSIHDRRTDFVAAYPELDALCERIGFGWDLSVVEWTSNPGWVMNELARAAQPPATIAGDDLRSAAIPELVTHLQTAHHRPLRWELNRLALLIGCLAAAHPNQRDIRALAIGFGHLRDSILVHLQQEEREAFPLCLAIDERFHHRHRHVGPPPDLAPLHAMAAGHLESGNDLEQLRALTERAGVSLDPDAALVVRGLRAMHADLILHTDIENGILLPAATYTGDLLALRARAEADDRAGQPPPEPD